MERYDGDQGLRTMIPDVDKLFWEVLPLPGLITFSKAAFCTPLPDPGSKGTFC